METLTYYAIYTSEKDHSFTNFTSVKNIHKKPIKIPLMEPIKLMIITFCATFLFVPSHRPFFFKGYFGKKEP